MNLNLMGRLKDNQVSGSLGAIISICILFAHQSFRNVLAMHIFYTPHIPSIRDGEGAEGRVQFYIEHQWKYIYNWS